MSVFFGSSWDLKRVGFVARAYSCKASRVENIISRFHRARQELTREDIKQRVLELLADAGDHADMILDGLIP